jgi:hypothetical protein
MVEFDRQGMLAEFGPARGVGAGAVRRQAIGLLAALHAGRAIWVEGHGMGEDQGECLVQAVGQTSTRSFARSCSPTRATASCQLVSAVGSLVGSGDAEVGWSPKPSAINVVSGSQGVEVCGTVAIISPFLEG